MYIATARLSDILWPFLLLLSFPIIFGAVLLKARKKYNESDAYLRNFSTLIFPIKSRMNNQPHNVQTNNMPYDNATYTMLEEYLVKNKLGSINIPTQVIRIYEKRDGSRIYQMLSRAPTFFAKSIRVNNYDTTTYFHVKDDQIVNMCLEKDLLNTIF
jgi:hypothetical protein